MDELSKQRLITELAEYLDDLPEAPADADSDGAGGEARAVDLYTLFSELAGVKNEVQRESRQIKRALDEFSNVFTALEDQGKRLGGELDARRQGQAEAVSNAQRPLLLDMIDLRDRLMHARELAASHRPKFLERLFAGRRFALAEDMAEGLGISLRRLDQALAHYDVAPIPALEQPIDPHRMRVTAVRSDPARTDGVVLEEVRRGYRRGDEVLRLAEVVANKSES